MSTKYNHIYTAENTKIARKIFRILRVRLGDKIHLIKNEIYADWSLDVPEDWIFGYCAGVEDRIEVETQINLT